MRAVVRNVKRVPESVRKTERLTGRVEVKELDPKRKCGHRTTVERMYRVIERVDGSVTNHLVFLDRHGWYCVHGRTCAAVRFAKAKR